MPILQLEHPITDFVTWRAAFDRDPIDRRGLGVRRHRIARPAGDEQYVIVELEFDSAAEAERAVDALERLWSSSAAPALAGRPRTRIVELIDDERYVSG